VEAAYDQDYLDTGFVNNARPDGVHKPPPTLHYPGDPWWLRWTAEQAGQRETAKQAEEARRDARPPPRACGRVSDETRPQALQLDITTKYK
jgi:hypothetical protein